jgi:putative glutamine amidotransferase
MEINLVRAAVSAGLPFLAICRGIQVVNVALGGTLYTHISDQLPGALHHEYQDSRPRDYLSHPVDVKAGSRLAALLGSTHLMVNSMHHQGVQHVAPGLSPTAAAEDGLVEALELSNHLFGVAVQWHPEALPKLAAMQALFGGLVQASRRPGA